VRAATAVAGALACAAAAMAGAALATGGGEEERTASAPAAARAGEAVWAANGCGSCHTFAPANAHAPIGPDLAVTLKGMPASYIRDSIVAPSKAAAPGFEVGVMPDDYGARIAPAELDALVEFIRAGVAR